jgi:hypothetical protein
MKRSKPFDSKKPFFPRKRPRAFDERDERSPRDERPHDGGAAHTANMLPARRGRAEIYEEDDAMTRAAATSAVLAKPLGELAKAFAVQSELLKTVQESQARLQHAIDNDKRSEVVVNSTNALNETFRGVRTVQQGLIERLERQDRAGKAGRVATIAGVLLAGAGAALGVWWIMGQKEESVDRLEDRLTSIEGSVLPEQKKIIDDVLAQKDELQSRVDAQSGDAGLLRSALERANLEKERVEAERLRLVSENAELRARAEKGETQSAAFEARIADLDEQVRSSLTKLDAARGEIDRLNDQVIARLRAGDRLAADVETAGKSMPIIGETTVAAPAAPPESAPGASGGHAAQPAPTPGGEAQAQKLLNRLLEDQRSNHVYRIESIGAVRDGRLEDVVLSESVPGKGVIKSVKARRLAVAVSPQGDIVDLNFEEGTVQQTGQSGGLGPAAPFYNHKYRLSVLCLNGQEWLRQREAYITAK